MKKVIGLFFLIPVFAWGMFVTEEDREEFGKVDIHEGESIDPFDCTGAGVVGCTQTEVIPICEDKCKSIIGLTQSDKVAIAFLSFDPKFFDERPLRGRSCTFHAKVACEVTYLQPAGNRADERMGPSGGGAINLFQNMGNFGGL